MISRYPIAPSPPSGRFAAEMVSRGSTAVADYATSIGESLIAMQDAAQWIEGWDDTDGWHAPGILTVAGNQAYMDLGGGTNRTFVVGADQDARVSTIIDFPGAAGGAPGTEWLFVGFCEDAADADFSTFGAMVGIGLDVQSGTVQGWDGSGVTDLSPPAVPAGLYITTLVADDAVMAFTMARANSTDRWTFSVPRGALTAINNVAIFLNDARGVSGAKVGTIGAKVAATTTAPPAGNVGFPAVHYGDTGGAGASRVRYSLPVGFDSRRPTPMVISFHGAGGDATSGAALEYECLAAGYIFVAADGYATNSVGAQPAIDEYTRVYKHMLERLPISGVALITESMGGTAGANTLSHRGIPLPSCWVGYFPLLNLLWAWDGNEDAQDAIITHYGVDPDGSDLAELTAGHSPVQTDPVLFAGVPCLIFHSYGDTVVTKSENSDAFKAAMAGYSEVTVIETEGEHGDASNLSPANVEIAMDFLRLHLGRG